MFEQANSLSIAEAPASEISVCRPIDDEVSVQDARFNDKVVGGGAEEEVVVGADQEFNGVADRGVDGQLKEEE